MITWTYDGETHQALVFPFCQQGEWKEWDMTMESDVDIENCFLYVDSSYSGIFWAKKSTDTTYRRIGTYSLAPSCYLGNLTADTPITLNFRMKFGYGDTYIGEQRLEIKVGGGPDVLPLEGSCGNDLWACPDEVVFWNVESTDKYWLDDCT